MYISKHVANAHIICQTNVLFTNAYTEGALQALGPRLCNVYRIAQNCGGGKLWRIWQIRSNSPKFHLLKFT